MKNVKQKNIPAGTRKTVFDNSAVHILKFICTLLFVVFLASYWLPRAIWCWVLDFEHFCNADWRAQSKTLKRHWPIATGQWTRTEQSQGFDQSEDSTGHWTQTSVNRQNGHVIGQHKRSREQHSLDDVTVSPETESFSLFHRFPRGGAACRFPAIFVLDTWPLSLFTWCDVTGTKWVALLPWRKRSDTRSFTPSIFVAWCCWTVRRSQNDRLQCSRHYSQIFYGEKNSFPSNFARTTGRFSWNFAKGLAVFAIL